MTRRTFRRLSALAFAVVLIASACSESEKAEETTATTELEATTTTAPRVLDATELDAALLTLGDLPPGWVEMPPEDSESPTTELCPGGQTPLKQEEHPTAEVSFSQGDYGPIIGQGLASAPDTEAHFDDITQAFDSCIGQTWTEDFDGTTVELTMTEVSSAQVGDETAAYRMSGSDSEGLITLTGDYVVVMNGSVGEVYFGVSIASPMLPTSPLDPAEFSTIIETGNAKVDEAIGGT